jgi:hypothetical protein
MFPSGGQQGDVETVYLGQFTDSNASAISQALVKADLHHWWKSPGRFSRVVFGGNWGTRLFVDEARLDEAKKIAAGVTD